MNLPTNHDDELRQLLDALVDNRLDDMSTKQLRQLLRDDAQACSYFCEFMALNSQLGLLFAQPLALPDFATKDAEIQSASTLILPLEPPHAGTSLGFLRSVFRATSRSAIAATLLVATILYGSFGLIVWQMSRHNTTVRPDQPVAHLVSSKDCRWNEHASPPRDGNLWASNGLQLISGVAELTFAEGATVIVEGPAEFVVRSPSEGFLQHGKLLATVPSRAIGFSVETPTATIVDLGTEFGVETDAQGATDVEVFQGKVDVSYESLTKGGESQQSVQMTAGTAKRFSKQDNGAGVAVRDVAPGMKRSLAKAVSVKSRRIFVQGAMASSEHDGAPATALIDGSGMKGECHATYHSDTVPVAPYHFWLTNRGRVKNEFVSFDFGQPCRLDSMKVWNLNDGRSNLHTSRGVKQADIYTSTSGKWDPLKEPSEWKLVVKDFKFSVATGTDDYDTPDLISLDGVEARFVAIVIADHLGPDPRPWAKPGEDFVGLSEVQFFGERLTRDQDVRPRRKASPQ
jgi:hypothetical protein